MVAEILMAVLANIRDGAEDTYRKGNRKTNFKAVMGWDIGDENSVAFIGLGASDKRELYPLYINKIRNVEVVKSAVAKSSSGIITIGYDAVKQQEFAINFKCSPKNWNNKSSMGIPYWQYMSDCIRGMSEAILQNCSNYCMVKNVATQDAKGNMQWKKDEVLLVVSCPASVIWCGKEIRKQYEKLISETTGISNVVVVEEPYAAVISVLDISNIGKEINLQQEGALVLDFGSPTADAPIFCQERKQSI